MVICSVVVQSVYSNDITIPNAFIRLKKKFQIKGIKVKCIEMSVRGKESAVVNTIKKKKSFNWKKG